MPGSHPDDTTPSPGPSRGFTATAALLGLVAVGLVVVLVYAFANRPDTPPTAAAPDPAPAAGVSVPAAPSSSTPTSTDSSGEQGRPAGCATTGTVETVPTATPSSITWSLAKGFAVPTSSTDGPALRSPAGVGYCYAHTPLGAVLSASNLGQGTGSLADINTDGLTYSITQNQYTAELAAAAASPQSSTTPTGYQLAGFRVISYSATDASIALAVQVTGPPAGLAQITVAMRWDRGDWRVVPQPGATIVATKGPLGSTAGFVPWSGVA